MKLFISYYSAEEAEAEDIANYLRLAFKDQGVEVFMASSWESITPGDDWQEKVISAVESADALIVLMSVSTLTRPWINFEMGVAWSKKIRIIILCHRGMSPAALERPYSSLQAVDINGLNMEDKLDVIQDAVSRALNISIPTMRMSPAISKSELPPSDDAMSFNMIHRTWSLRPGAHIGERAKGRFLIGTVWPARNDHAQEVGLTPGEALNVRLFMGATNETRYFYAMVQGSNAKFFETVVRDETFIEAEVELAGALLSDDRNQPLSIIRDFNVVSSPDKAA